MHHARNKAAVARFALSPVALVVASLLQPLAAPAQAQEPSPRLKASPQLREDIPADARHQLPTFVEGDRISGQVEIDTSVEGNAVLRRGDTVIRANRIDYHQPDDLARATGQVHINKAGNIFEGPEAQLHLDSYEGFFTQPHYQFLRNGGYGDAERMDFIDDTHSVVHRASYTTCKRRPGPSWMPDWILRASSISFDEEEEVGHAKNVLLRFKGLPILPVPAMSFPIGEQRKSGFLPPTVSLDNRSGFETTIPYYWNIAPNRDATIYPTLMTKRGIDLGAEFRYLEPQYNGLVRGNFMPNDRLRGRERWGISARHNAPSLTLPLIGDARFTMNVNRVSDDDYWRDFSRNSDSLTQRLLTSDINLAWNTGTWGHAARLLKWQTLQDLSAPIIPPYDRAPEYTVRQTRTGLPGGFDTYVEADYTHFTHTVSDPVRTLFGPQAEAVSQPNAQRVYFLGQVSRPWQAPGWFVVPKLQFHARHYNYDFPTLTTGQKSAGVAVPTFSTDAGLVLERDTSLFGRAFVQTLEPRAFFVYTPLRDQNQLPNYESALSDFNFATIYTENEFSGWDRISATKSLTLGASTRLIDADTGAEAAKFGVAQRVRMQDQPVTIPGTTPASERLSDILFGASVNLTRQLSVNTTLQYNPHLHEWEREVVGVRYSPTNYRVINAAYRMTRGLPPPIGTGSEQIDVGWQWPLNDLWGDFGRDLGTGQGLGEGRWYSVGRLNLDLEAHRLVEGLVGLEYDAGCWLGRIVLERLQTGTNSSNKRILFQLEFVGLSHLGSNALQTLKRNIPRYQYLRERTVAPSRFTNFE